LVEEEAAARQKKEGKAEGEEAVARQLKKEKAKEVEEEAVARQPPKQSKRPRVARKNMLPR
jgi:hypothetical protein